MLLSLSTWPEVERHLERSQGIVVPLGSTEQHGPTGLFGTDAICATAIAHGLGERVEVVVGPTLELGCNAFNLAFPGTISLRATTLMALVGDYVDSLARQGFRAFYFLNGHGGNVAPVRAAFHDLRSRPELSAVRLRLRSWWELPGVGELRQELYGRWEGMHATPSEIAITRHLHPDRVGSAELPRPDPLSTEFLRDHADDQHGPAEAHRARFPDGRVGSDPSLATATAGRRLLEVAIADAAIDLRAFLDGDQGTGRSAP